MKYVDSLSSIMNYATKKREVASNNISNQNTNGFKAGVVDWNDKFGQMVSTLKITDDKHIPVEGNKKSFIEKQDLTTQITSNGNNVDLNKEMIELMKSNQITSLAIQMYNKHSEGMSAARGN